METNDQVKIAVRSLVDLAVQAEKCMSRGSFSYKDMGEVVLLKQMIDVIKEHYVAPRKED